MDEESATADSRVTTTSGCFGGICTAQRTFSLNALRLTDKTCGFRRTRQRRSHAGTRLPRSLVRQASTDLRFSRQSRSILWAVNFRSSANDDGNSIRYIWKIHATFCLSICTGRVSNIWRRRHQPSRLVCRTAPPLLKRLCLHVSRTSIARSASFACSWLICGLLRSPAPCTPPQPCSPSDRR
jgi:hypothetical protein